MHVVWRSSSCGQRETNVSVSVTKQEVDRLRPFCDKQKMQFIKKKKKDMVRVSEQSSAQSPKRKENLKKKATQTINGRAAMVGP